MNKITLTLIVFGTLMLSTFLNWAWGRRALPEASAKLQREIGDQLARMLLGGAVKDGDTVVADARLMSADDVANAAEFGTLGGERSGLELRVRES